MKLATVVGIVLLSTLLQIVLARFAIGGRFTFDLVLVGVVFVALQAGPVAGMLAGTIGGVTLDLVSGGLVGVGGLLKTLIGFAAGAMGTRLVVAKPYARALIVGAATLIHAFLAGGLQAVIDQEWLGLSWAAILGETAVNSVAGFLAFRIVESAGSASRGRSRHRSAWGRRQW